MTQPVNVRFEHYEAGAIGTEEAKPRISWTLDATGEDNEQISYEIELTKTSSDSSEIFKITGQDFLYVPWPGTSLETRERVGVRVRVQLRSGKVTDWSNSAFVERGIAQPSEWKCQLIEPDAKEGREPTQLRPVIFRRNFTLPKRIKKARAYITAHGIYEAHLNGKRVGDHIFPPGWTPYEAKLLYQTYDVTDHLTQGENSFEIEVAEGWYSGKLGFTGGANFWGTEVGAIAMIVSEDDDGNETAVGTDEEWKWAYGARVVAGIYDGEEYVSKEAVTDKTTWHKVHSKPLSDHLFAQTAPPVRKMEEMKIQAVTQSPSGKMIWDFGQNFVGWVRVKVSGPPETVISLQFAEVLEDGEAATRPLRTARCRDSITLGEEQSLEWEPKFTFHGFRYVSVEGWPGEFDMNSVTGIVLQTEMQRLGTFRCSNKLLNKLQENVVWSMRGNFLALPTDCPQRNERLGWTGDINAFADTANYLYDTTGMLQSWLDDLKIDQRRMNGVVPLTVPDILGRGSPLGEMVQAIWGDAAVMVPWSIYEATGDIKILEVQFDSMKSWLGAIPRASSGLWSQTSKLNLGDWLDPAAPPAEPGNATTDAYLVSDAFLCYVTKLMSKIASLIGSSTDAERFAQEAEKLKKAFTQEYITPAGRMSCNTQTAFTLALQFDLFSTPDLATAAAERLSLLIRRNARFKIATGFAGTPFIGHALTKHNLSHVFYRMLLNRENPSWLYPVTMGSTTIWERWDSMLPDGSINPGEMTSFNHYALGSVADWMYKVIAGLRVAEAGWKVFDVEPVPGGGIRWAEASHISPYGKCGVRWEITTNDDEEDRLWLEVTVPPYSKAQVKLPWWREAVEVTSGVKEWKDEKVPTIEPVRAILPPFWPEPDAMPWEKDEFVPHGWN